MIHVPSVMSKKVILHNSNQFQFQIQLFTVENLRFKTCLAFLKYSSTKLSNGMIKNLEEKDGQRQLLYYVRACDKVLSQLVYIGKKFVFLKEHLYSINQ